jgi:nitroreductase
MDMIDAIRQRRSVRDYVPTPLSSEALESLVDAAIQAPSAMNEQPWRFTIISNRTLLDLISRESKAYMLAALQSPPDVDRYRTLLTSEDFHIFYRAPALIVISSPANSRWAIEDCALAAQNLMLAAYAANLGTCWIGFAQSWLGTKEGKQAIGLPDEFLPVAPIIVGHPNSATVLVPRNEPHIDWIN